MQCPRCQHESPSHAKFCLDCGAPFKRTHESGPPVASYTDLQHALSETQEQQTATAEVLQTRTRELTEALEQQTATSEILRVISSSPTDIGPVLDAVAESAVRLCGALDATILRLEADTLRVAAHYGPIRAPLGLVIPMTRGTLGGRSILDRRTVHVTDIQAESEEFPEASRFGREFGHRAILSVPLMREGVAIGAIQLRRSEALPFSERQIALLQSFADQAVIAIENVRLFKELEARNKDLTEALEQQTATSEILRAIASSPTNLEPIFDAILTSAMRLTGAVQCAVAGFDGEMVTLLASNASREAHEAMRRACPYRASRTGIVGRVVLDRAVVHVPDVMQDPEYSFQDTATAAKYRAILGVPMFRETDVIGALTAMRAAPGPFSDAQIELFRTFADQAVIAIENVRLFNELQEKNRALTTAHSQVTEALEQQTATAEILRVISSSPTDVQPVFDAIVRSAVLLCDAVFGAAFRFDGEKLHLTANHNLGPVERSFPMPVHSEHVTGRAVLERSVMHVPDTRDAPQFAITRALAESAGYRSVLSVPMLREGEPIGAITVGRAVAEPFSDSRIALLRSFADQAVIAVENVRLFKELEARNSELSEALEQQTATAEILRALSSSPTEIRPVLETLVHAAARFCGATNVALSNLDGGVLRGAAAAGPLREEIVRRYGSIEALEIPVTRESVSGRAVSERRTLHIHDLAAEPEDEFPVGRELQRQLGHHTMVATPLLREGTPIGAIALIRTEVRPFSDKQLQLLQTFADQAVIAIENVRLPIARARGPRC